MSSLPRIISKQLIRPTRTIYDDNTRRLVKHSTSHDTRTCHERFHSDGDQSQAFDNSPSKHSHSYHNICLAHVWSSYFSWSKMTDFLTHCVERSNEEAKWRACWSLQRSTSWIRISAVLHTLVNVWFAPSWLALNHTRKTILILAAAKQIQLMLRSVP